MKKIAFIIVVGIALSACATEPPPGQLNPNSMVADLSSGYFNSTSAQAIDQGAYISITAEQNLGGPADEITINIPKSDVVPYEITVPPDPDAVVAYYDASNSTQYYALSGEGSLTIYVTSLTPTVQGTFSATTVATSSLDSARVISNGAFNAAY
jgi:hypothetical protein